MKIVRERPSQRRHHRVTAPLLVEWDGGHVRATDWSLGGLKLDGVCADGLSAGEAREIGVSLPFQGFDVRFSVRAEVVRLDKDHGTIAFRFVDLGDRETGMLTHFVDELVRGSMVEIEDTIQRIDVPVTPVSTKPDPNPTASVPVRRWPIKTIAVSAFYLAAGCALAAYLAFVVYANMYKLEVTTAVVSAPIDIVVATGDGTVDYGQLAVGQEVAAGDRLAAIADDDLEHRIDIARIDAARAEADRTRIEQLLAAEIGRHADRVVVAHNNRERMSADVLALGERLKYARALLAHYWAAYRSNARGLPNVLETADYVAELEGQLEIARVNVGELDETSTGGYAGDFFDFARIQQRIDELSIDLERSAAEATFAADHVAALEHHRARLDVFSPFDGQIVALDEPAGASVIRGDPILAVERAGARYIDAYLNQEEVGLVGLGDRATVYLPALDLRVAAVVDRIDRTAGFVDEQSSQYVWRGPQDRSARVILAFEEETLIEDLSAGLPATVIFERRSDGGGMLLLPDWVHTSFGFG